MTLPILALKILLLIALTSFAVKRLLTFLRFLQQQDYNNARFLKWVVSHSLLDRKLSFVLIVILLSAFVLSELAVLLLVIFAFAFFAWYERDARFYGKKPLLLTHRAQRILSVAVALCLMVALLPLLLVTPFWSLLIWILFAQVIPIILTLANLLLAPFETWTQRKYWNLAQQRLQELDPFVIGVTGSFGKTSVKHILGHILSTTSSALITPGSVNTPMGISRVIREKLNAAHKYFVVEMGAYRQGSIAKICRLVAPKMGLITAVGEAHLERFKSLETTANTKLELADSVISSGGEMVMATSVARFQSYQRRRLPQKSITLCETDGLKEINQTAKGIQVTVAEAKEGQQWVLQAPIYGKHQGANIALAFVAARALGIDAQSIQTALKSLPQIRHRLEVKPQPNGTCIIDDAFNANPDGFVAGLGVLNLLHKKPGRRILVTPGIVELGAQHAAVHADLGTKVADCVDIAIVVMASRIPSFVQAIRAARSNIQLIEVESFAQARAWLANNTKSPDVILLENDLPDLFEAMPLL
ncbi:MAG: UDP-N-acetylmuramoyl-tripeptide--D-alanyl-D-alanine ligase [Pseudomonadota bacterium]